MSRTDNALRRGGLSPRLLAITTVDVMAWVLLRPWLRALQDAGFEVHLACSPGQYCDRLAAEGFAIHKVALRRSCNPISHLRALVGVVRLLRKERFDIINTHSPVAGAVGRFGAWLTSCPCVAYTVHGFYFHDRMQFPLRMFHMTLEWLLGRCTDRFMFVSEEDRLTALRTGIARNPGATITIYNGVGLEKFPYRDSTPASILDRRIQLGLPAKGRIVGIVGRIVKEKGYREFISMAKALLDEGRDVTFLIVGASLPSDRDQFSLSVKKKLHSLGIERHFVLTGFTENVADYLAAMDVFVLPSYREGFPRSILEAMSVGLPVVATDIRGCREAVVNGKTGCIVPPQDAVALANAVRLLLDDAPRCSEMGAAGRERVEQCFDERRVQERFVSAFGGWPRGARRASGEVLC